MAILVADSGSSKTDWRLCMESKQIMQFESIGLNPNFVNEEVFHQVLSVTFDEAIRMLVKQVHFYGAGCGSEQNKLLVQKALKDIFPNALVVVESDMLGAARALCGSRPGIAAILGTGMNTCYYDGTQISVQPISLGYILGDEGSGAYLGKVLLRAYLRNELPEQIKVNFEKRFELSAPQIIDAIYRQAFPNKFLAQFAKFIYQNSKHSFMQNIIIEAFTKFFKEHIAHYPNYKHTAIHFTGSVAFYFSNLLRRVATEEGIIVGSIVEKPIAAIALYHFDE